MSKVAVVYWSGSGNTEVMAKAIVDGAKAAGGEADLFEVESFGEGQLKEYGSIAFGCPAMGDEELEDTVFEPAFAAVENKLGGKKVALFGSYGWGDGTWMRLWEERCNNSGINLIGEGLILNEMPDDDGIKECEKLGAALV